MLLTTPQVVNRFKCPNCGNDRDFFEITDDIITTTYYVQNQDGSFSIEEQNSQSLGCCRLFCGNCDQDLTPYRQRLCEMTF